MIAEVKPDNWYVLITDIHSEYNTAQKLDALGFMVYCPSEPTFIQWEGNHKRVFVPLFRGCIFVSGDEDKLFAALSEVRGTLLLNDEGRPVSIVALKAELTAKFLQLLNL